MEEIRRLCEITRDSTDWNDYEALEYAILQQSYTIEDEGDKLDTQRGTIDELKEDKFIAIRKDYSSDTGASRIVNKEFRDQEAPLIVSEEVLKRVEKRLRTTIRRADVVRSRHIKFMADAKREAGFTG